MKEKEAQYMASHMVIAKTLGQNADEARERHSWQGVWSIPSCKGAKTAKGDGFVVVACPYATVNGLTEAGAIHVWIEKTESATKITAPEGLEYGGLEGHYKDRDGHFGIGASWFWARAS